VNNLNAIQGNVIPFFKRFGFLSAKKKKDFQIFQQIVSMMNIEEHLTKEGIKKILKLRNEMNDGGKRTYSDEEILKSFDVSSETIRQISVRETN
jgi:DNA-directed RNA polymerase sigma subunit (sigma70/sigma32)